jgi:ATP-binding cassette subfamily C (CFTR/MRP) protein 1
MAVNSTTSAKRLSNFFFAEEVADAPHIRKKQSHTSPEQQPFSENDEIKLLEHVQDNEQEIDAINDDEEEEKDLAAVFRNASFAYDPEKPILHDINLEVKRGEFTCIVGRVGCGKSSLLSAMFGEAQRIEGYLSVRGKLSYCCEKPWIINTSIRENVL